MRIHDGPDFEARARRCTGGGPVAGQSTVRSTVRDRHDPKAPVKVAPVRIGANVWIAAQAGILPGTVIGDNSVVRFGAVCSGAYPADSLVAQAPATVICHLQD